MLQAISAAGVTHAVTKACRRGSLTNCGCSRHNPLGNMTSDGTWEWSGCHDDLGYGLDKSQEFMDRNNGRDIRTLLHLHNNRAGRVVSDWSVVKHILLVCWFVWFFAGKIARALQRECSFSSDKSSELTHQQDMFCFNHAFASYTSNNIVKNVDQSPI